MLRRHSWLILVAAMPIGIATAQAQRRNLSSRGRTPKNVTAIKDITYGRSGGRSLKLDLYKPLRPASRKLPVVVWIHGGGWRGKDKAEGIYFLTPLAETNRYICVSINYRLSGEAIWPAQIHDCKAAIRWLRANATTYGIEPERIGVWGASAGAHLAAFLGTSGGIDKFEGRTNKLTHSSRVTAVASYFAPADLTLDPSKGTARPLLLGGPVLEKIDLARSASATTHITADDPPFLHAHGTADSVVPLEQSQRFHAALRKQGLESTLITVPGGTHGLRGHHASLAARVLRFFDKHLGKPVPDRKKLGDALDEALKGEK